MLYLSQEEFAQPEREGKLGVQMWPDWHYGVLSMYGADFGLNHLMGSKQLNLVILNNLIDYPSANTESVYDKIHIHVFHGDDLFSKFAFKMGHYDNMTITDSNQIKFYCLKMAMEAKKVKTSNLKVQFSNQILNKVWIRIWINLYFQVCLLTFFNVSLNMICQTFDSQNLVV